ncbi:hypothetical protein [Mucilaginibacter lacusdianchii]|uniref:hypothetical protein n=1 Tax=Mucilaginibacter lacusdianchii TaxID=2684211 RepID=UPI00131CF43D|nr:hypothetical protein [Mucilaginibacter sp. JXJ CY 39]
MITAPVAHIILCSLHIAGRISLSIILITLICFLLGIVLPVLASYLDIINLPPGTKCATPSVGFAFLGISLTAVVIPVSTIIFSVITYYKKKKLNNSVA